MMTTSNAPPELSGLSCDVCNDEPALGVAAVPGVPMSVAYGARCLAANAHPYGIVVVNTAMIGGREHAAEWWAELVDNTLRHLGKSREQFDVDVQRELEAQAADERAYEEEQRRRDAEASSETSGDQPGPPRPPQGRPEAPQ